MLNQPQHTPSNKSELWVPAALVNYFSGAKTYPLCKRRYKETAQTKNCGTVRTTRRHITSDSKLADLLPIMLYAQKQELDAEVLACVRGA